jgi:hypothetical protein
MIGTVLTGPKGEVLSAVSLYQPNTQVSLFTGKVRQDYAVGSLIQTRPFREFNDLSVIEVMARDQKVWLTYVEPPSIDPDEAWRYDGKRPLARNKLISIAAQVTANLLVPNVFAQNENDEADQEAASVMRDLIEWNIDNSDYDMSFLFGVISGLVNPAIYMSTDFIESLISIKEKDAQGKITKRELIDDVLSGLKVGVVPVDEVLITNAYQFDVQKQRAIIRRKFLDYDELEARYGKHPNWKYVRPGIKTFYDAANKGFYDQKDDNLITLGEEVTYMNRREDTECVFVNGIYFGDENPDNNPMKHRDYLNRPKYNLAKSGYEPIDEKRFHYYKSGASKLFEDDRLLNTMTRLAMDSSTLLGFPPIGVSGNKSITSKVMVPAAVTTFGSDSKVTPLTTGINNKPLFDAITKTEQSMTESTTDNLSAGIPPSNDMTAYEISKLQQNAKIQLGLFGKMISKLTEDVGYLMIDDIIQHQTVAEVSEIEDNETRLHFASFLLPDKTVDGQQVTKKIQFVPGELPTKDNALPVQFNLMKKEGGLQSDQRIYLVNPKAFSKLRFKLKVSADNLVPKSDLIEKAMNFEAYDRMNGDPLFDQVAIRKDFLLDSFDKTKGHADKYMSKNQGQMPGQPPVPGQMPMQGTPGAGAPGQNPSGGMPPKKRPMFSPMRMPLSTLANQ